MSEKYNADFQCTPAQYHANLEKLWKALGVTGPQEKNCFEMAADEIARLKAQIREV